MVRFTEGLELALFEMLFTLLCGADTEGLALFELFLTLLGGAGYGGSGAGYIQAVLRCVE
jgi:hypothetical protein